MADALCGPSTALQSFQKHAQVDRTLQQDRLTAPIHSPGQGFRSLDPRAGSLDADFHAFENAQPHPFALEQTPGSQPFHHGQTPVRSAMAPPPMKWAADFQKLHLSDQPIPAQQFRVEAPLVRSAPGGWQTEFARQRNSGMSAIAQGKQAALDYQRQSSGFAAQSFSPFDGIQQQFPMGGQYGQMDLSSVQSEHAQMQQSHEQVSAQDWSQAFEEAQETSSRVEDVTSIAHQQILHEDGAYTNDRSQMEDTPDIQQPENICIGSDAIEYKELQDRTADQNAHDANALARVAGELLHNVQHESDNKFQNSQFLDLMRKIRDRQVEVRNNDFETIQGQSLSASQRSEPLPMTDPAQQDNSFVFPDMNVVHKPDSADVVDYTFDSDQYPSQRHTHDLHPGGRLYPGSPEPQLVSMSGGVGPGLSDNLDKLDQNMADIHLQSTSGQRTTLA